MAERDEGNAQPETSASTPNSPSEVTNSAKAAKDRKCPFCSQAFTSSSLGRHLDLYIKSKNPKPPDGVHDVVEIRKLRGNITRRQPRTSTRGPGGSNGSNGGYESVDRDSEPPSTAARMPSRPDRAMLDDSPVQSGPQSPRIGHANRPSTTFNSANWQATGVINNLPPRELSRNATRPASATSEGQAQRVHDMRHDAGGNRFERPEYESESMWKLQEAAELGRAAEMALREVLGSLEAAQKTASPQHLYKEFDFFALNFPGLTLAILPAPSTLFSPTPFAAADSWTLGPPSKRQFETVGRFLNERVALCRKTDHVPDSLAFRYHAHLAGAWEHWQELSDQDRASVWNLEVLRCVSRGHDQQRQLRLRLENSEQRVRHLETEFDRLSRCQLPREYLMHPPNTTAIPTDVMKEVKPSQFKSEVATMGYDAEAILAKWRKTIRATTRRPNPVTHSGVSTFRQPQVKVNTLPEDIIKNGSVWSIGGPMPRDRDQPANCAPHGDATYYTPPEPGVVVGADDDGEHTVGAETDADGEAETTSANGSRSGGNDTALVRRRIGDSLRNDVNRPNSLNMNGKRTLDAGGASGRSSGTKLYKEHVVEGDKRDD